MFSLLVCASQLVFDIYAINIFFYYLRYKIAIYIIL